LGNREDLMEREVSSDSVRLKASKITRSNLLSLMKIDIYCKSKSLKFKKGDIEKEAKIMEKVSVDTKYFKYGKVKKTNLEIYILAFARLAGLISGDEKYFKTKEFREDLDNILNMAKNE
jgi:hypothetical protein